MLHRLSVVVFAIGALAVQVLHGAPRENYLPNPGFEEGMKFWDLGSSPNGDIKLDDSVSHSGKKSLCMKYHTDADGRLSNYIVAANQLSAVLEPGRVYTVSGWIKIAGVPPGKTGPIAYFCEGHAERGHTPVVSGNTDPAKNNGWVFVSFHYTPPPSDSIGHQFRCQCHSTNDGMAGAVWFDDLKIEEGDKPTAFRPDWIEPAELYTRETPIPWFPVPLEFRCSLDVVTPHVELARPYCRRRAVLWAGFYNNARVGCELAERGDLTLDSVVLNASSVDAAGVRMHHEKCVEVLRARLGIEPKLPLERSPQVLVIEQGTFELLNHQDRVAILQRIGQGMGCVVPLGPIRVRDHPGAVVTPKIKELISSGRKTPAAGPRPRPHGDERRATPAMVSRHARHRNGLQRHAASRLSIDEQAARGCSRRRAAVAAGRKHDLDGDRLRPRGKRAGSRLPRLADNL